MICKLFEFRTFCLFLKLAIALIQKPNKTRYHTVGHWQEAIKKAFHSGIFLKKIDLFWNHYVNRL